MDWTKKPKQKVGELKARVRSGCGVQGEELEKKGKKAGVNGVKGGLGSEMMNARKQGPAERDMVKARRGKGLSVKGVMSLGYSEGNVQGRG